MYMSLEKVVHLTGLDLFFVQPTMLINTQGAILTKTEKMFTNTTIKHIKVILIATMEMIIGLQICMNPIITGTVEILHGVGFPPTPNA